MNKILLLSYPRSGSNLVAYILEEAMGICVEGISILIDVNCKSINPNYNSSCIAHKSHGHLGELGDAESKHDGLIFCLRDYKKSIVKHARDTKIETLKQYARLLSCDENGGNPDYLYLLKYYDDWTKPKMLIYYEELLKSDLTVQKIYWFADSFYEADYEKYKQFQFNRLEHFDRAYHQYKEKDHPEFRGVDTEFILNDVQRREFDKYMKDKSPKLFEKYLSRYVA